MSVSGSEAEFEIVDTLQGERFVATSRVVSSLVKLIAQGKVDEAVEPLEALRIPNERLRAILAANDRLAACVLGVLARTLSARPRKLEGPIGVMVG